MGVGGWGDEDLKGFLGEGGGEFFAPFCEEVTGVEVVVEGEFFEFMEGMEAVEIEMEDGAVRGGVSVDEGEGWACDGVGGAEAVEDAGDETGFSGTEWAGEDEAGMVFPGRRPTGCEVEGFFLGGGGFGLVEGPKGVCFHCGNRFELVR